MKKKRRKILQHLTFLELRRPFDLENNVKVTVWVYDLENNKTTRPAARRKNKPSRVQIGQMV
jgi:hypothetical protein